MPNRSALVDALVLLAAGDRDAARHALAHPSAALGHPRLAAALDAHLRRGDGAGVYDQSTAFDRFISGGGNVALYDATIAAVRDRWLDGGPATVVDLGCGDGRVPLTACATWPSDRRRPSLDLVDASAALLTDAQARADREGIVVRLHQADMTTFAMSHLSTRWDLAESTFALHAVEPDLRAELLASLAGQVGRLVIVEFDVPALDGDEWLAHLADRYEEGLGEYPDDEVVVHGFLLPVLVGQVENRDRRVTWEQPAAAWAEDLREAGFATVDVAPVSPYWWAPAVCLDARP